MFLHIFQQITKSFYVESLKGYITYSQKPRFSWYRWHTETYQKETETFLNERFGFREWYVRINNQYKYWMFNHAMAKGVVVGKNGELYEKDYIMAYYGHDYRGYYTILDICAKMKLLQDTLSKLNTKFLVVMAPGKATFCPENIPDWIEKNSDSTNYKTYAKLLDYFGVNHIDFNKHFVDIKDTIKYKLFPIAGVHWSTYGEYYAFDSIIRYMEKQTGKDLPNLDISEVEFSRTPRHRDSDIGNGMNLIFNIDKDQYAYPKLKIDQENKTRLNAIVISDSFYWGVFGRNITGKVFADNQFWFYYKQFISKKTERTKNQVKIKNEIENTDVLILMGSEHNIRDIGYGFIWDAFSFYYQNYSVDNYIINKFVEDYKQKLRDSIIKSENNGIILNQSLLSKYADSLINNNELFLKKIQDFKQKATKNFYIYKTIEEIRKNEKWYNRIKIKSFTEKIPINKLLLLEGEYAYNEKNKVWKNEQEKQVKESKTQIDNIILEIKSNEVWFNKIKEKAKQQGEDIEIALKREAEWLYNYRLKEQK
ncbi:MAG: hypothetical protein JXR58_13405 [Bacteroidales bacterium]|nr:hypothetical protein [Bacteroidales bacterium]